ncbi:MAG: DUF5916 domain-containing protein [Flavobacterium sp.]
MTLRIALALALLFNTIVFGQNNIPVDSAQNTSTPEKKKLNSVFTSDKIIIDGDLNEPIWNTAEVATDFMMFDPDNGKPIAQEKKTDVKVVYDNDAIYIGAILNDDDPSKIMREITQRDDDGSSDFFGVGINGYNDGQQEFRFFVTAAGVQLDCNSNPQTGEDFSWDAIWESKAKLTDKGWAVEIKLPYSALRFSKDSKQTWGMNFYRQIRRYRQLYTWNFVDNKKGSLEQQQGELHGIENVKTPTRLFFFPYASVYVNKDKDGTKTEFKGGLDIKYGINDAFTLDAILVPDFGQTAFDNQILNLGPFEQQFNENRPFFTEGTDLFNKGNLFYSRRIGGDPSHEPELADNEEFTEPFPTSVNLLNALKVSGRTKGGLGIGVLNAITKKTDVTIQKTTITANPNPSDPDIIKIEQRKETVEPLANFNIVSLDQRFHKNSSVSFVNTSVVRDGAFRDANVSALVFDLNTKKNTFNLSGDFKYSYVNEYQKEENKNGYNTSLNFAETSGKVRFNVNANYVSKEFDNNDLGINFQTNFYGIYSNVNYRILNPNKTFNTLRVNANVFSEFENITGKIQGGNINFNLNATVKSNDGFGIGLNIMPLKVNDFYQAQSDGRFVIIPEYYNSWVYISSNYNRKFAIDFNPYYGFNNEPGRNDYGFDLSPRFRASNKLLFIADYNYAKENKTKGRVTEVGSDIIFAQRDINTSSLSLKGKYAISNKMTINLTTRYYWRYVENLKFQKLENDGSLVDTEYLNPENKNFGAWNVDCSYTWWLSPGSQLNVLYRNNSLNSRRNLDDVDKNFSRNLNSMFGDKLQHTFSISLRYFLDYNRVKSWI